jgi:hypothetical protein
MGFAFSLLLSPNSIPTPLTLTYPPALCLMWTTNVCPVVLLIYRWPHTSRSVSGCKFINHQGEIGMYSINFFPKTGSLLTSFSSLWENTWETQRRKNLFWLTVQRFWSRSHLILSFLCTRWGRASWWKGMQRKAAHLMAERETERQREITPPRTNLQLGPTS